jgi:hypothetical protein
MARLDNPILDANSQGEPVQRFSISLFIFCKRLKYDSKLFMAFGIN